MSEPIPESVPTSADPRSKRPLKKRALSPTSSQAATLSALFAKPDQEIRLPASSTTLTTSHPGSAPPEIVANVQGSSAGAGSGEFHVYKASRRREYERLRGMDEEVKKEKDAEEFEKLKKDRENKDAEKTRKNREKREKLKARRGKGGKGGAAVEGRDAGQDKPGGMKGPRVTIPAPGEEESENGEAMVGMQEAGLIIHDDD